MTKETVGPVHHLRGSASLQTTELQLWADELDYNEETGDAQARGNVHFKHFQQGEELWADQVDYNLQHETGKFQNVRGTSPPRIDPRPGLLTTSNPFYFEGRWAERIKDRSSCTTASLPTAGCPRLGGRCGPEVRHRPADRALAYRAVFRLRAIPLLYAPVFYKSLEEQPRKSGFLTPNIGNSSRRGKMVGVGYYWAINRSYDATYRAQWFTQRGFAHTVDFRGKPSQSSGFNLYLYGVNDRGAETVTTASAARKAASYLWLSGPADLGRGFQRAGTCNYLTSMRFRTCFHRILQRGHLLGGPLHRLRRATLVGLRPEPRRFARLENIQDAGAYDARP